jgi:hypothetical protein
MAIDRNKKKKKKSTPPPAPAPDAEPEDESEEKPPVDKRTKFGKLWDKLTGKNQPPSAGNPGTDEFGYMRTGEQRPRFGMRLKNALIGKAPELQKFGIFQPDQERAAMQLLQQALQNYGSLEERSQIPESQIMPGLLQQIANPDQTRFSFEPFANVARANFAQTTLPGIAERYTQMGQGGGGSSGYGQEFGGAKAGLEAQLAALGSQHGQAQHQFGLQHLLAQQQLGLGSELGRNKVGLLNQGQNNAVLQHLLSIGMTPRFHTNYQQNVPGLLPNTLQGVAPAVAKYALGGL